jgi:hypothetical protein
LRKSINRKSMMLCKRSIPGNVLVQNIVPAEDQKDHPPRISRMSTFQELVVLGEVHGSMGLCRANSCNLFFRVGKVVFFNFIAMAAKNTWPRKGMCFLKTCWATTIFQPTRAFAGGQE